MKNKGIVFLSTFLIIMAIVIIMPIKVKANSENSINVSTVEEFKEAVESNNNIVLTEDIDITSLMTKPNSPAVLDVSEKIIDLNEHKLSANNFTVIFEGENFTIKNGTLDSKGDAYALFIGDELGANNVTIEDVTVLGGINVYNSTNVVIRNSNVTGTLYYAIWCDENGHVTIESGNYTSKATNTTSILGISKTEGELRIEGGTFDTNGKELVLVSKDESGNEKFNKPIISGGVFDIEVPKEYYKEGAELIDLGNNTWGVCDHSRTVVKNAKAPTYVDKGYTGDIYCASCDKLIKKGEEIPVLTHSSGGEQESITNLKDEKTNIKLEFEKGVLSDDVKLEIKPVLEGKTYESIKKMLEEQEKFVAFDINLLKNGIKIQPNGKIRVNIPVPNNFDKKSLIVYRIEENSKKEYDVKVVTIDNLSYAQFETDHFSNYVLVEKKIITNTDIKKPIADEPILNKGEKDDTPKTGNINIINHVLVAIVRYCITPNLLAK